MTTLTVYSTKDDVIQATNPTTNFGTSENFAIKYYSTDMRHSVLQFDLSSLPSGAIVSSVKLRLYCNYVDNTTNLNFGVYRLLLSWTELGVTWNSRDGSNNWNTAGAQGSGTDRAADALGTGAVTGTGWIEITFSDLTEFNNMVNSNNGMVLIPFSGGSTGNKRFSTRESANDPELVIEYEIITAIPQAVWFT
jgi:hypothetical protein